MRLSVIIPAYNEEKRIPHTLLEIDKYLSRQNYDYEILVINDGSQDKTAEVVRGLENIIDSLRLIDNTINRGKGSVVKQGMLEAKGQFRLFTDADNSTTIDHIEKFWPYFDKGFDVVIGSIAVSGSKIQETAAWYRRILGRVAKLIIRTIAIWEVHDTQRGFKMFTAQAAEDIFSRQTIMRFGFDIEILVIAKKLGYKIKEVPIVWNNPAGSKVTAGSYINTFKELIRIKINNWKGKYDK